MTSRSRWRKTGRIIPAPVPEIAQLPTDIFMNMNDRTRALFRSSSKIMRDIVDRTVPITGNTAFNYLNDDYYLSFKKYLDNLSKSEGEAISNEVLDFLYSKLRDNLKEFIGKEANYHLYYFGEYFCITIEDLTTDDIQYMIYFTWFTEAVVNNQKRIAKLIFDKAILPNLEKYIIIPEYVLFIIYKVALRWKDETYIGSCDSHDPYISMMIELFEDMTDFNFDYFDDEISNELYDEYLETGPIHTRWGP